MTWRELYEFALIEVNKLNAPSLLLEDYNYFINKAVQQYMNLAYNKFDISQQTNDDLRVLTTSRTYKSDEITNNTITLPGDYVHLLNCIVGVSKTSANKNNCSSSSKTPNLIAAKRVTSDSYAGILNNYYLRPAVNRPYYMLKSSDTHVVAPLVEDPEQNRIANRYNSQLEIKCGDGQVNEIHIDYVRAPQKINLTEEMIWEDDFGGAIPSLEFPDYICYEIINIFVKLLMENAGDPRLQTNLAVNTTIPSGA